MLTCTCYLCMVILIVCMAITESNALDLCTAEEPCNHDNQSSQMLLVHPMIRLHISPLASVYSIILFLLSKGELWSLILGCARSIWLDWLSWLQCSWTVPSCFAWKSMHQKDLYMIICMQAKYKRTLLICLWYAYKSFCIQSTKEMSQESVHGRIIRDQKWCAYMNPHTKVWCFVCCMHHKVWPNSICCRN